MNDTINTGGPAFPVAFVQGTDPHGADAAPGSDGMTLLDWFAGQALAGLVSRLPYSGYEDAAEDAYKAASSMLAEKARREATCKDGLQVPDHSPDAGKMARLEEEKRELVEELQSLEVWGDELDANIGPPDRNCSCHINPPCNDCVDFTGQREAKRGWKDAKSKARTILAKHQKQKKETKP